MTTRTLLFAGGVILAATSAAGCDRISTPATPTVLPTSPEPVGDLTLTGRVMDHSSPGETGIENVAVTIARGTYIRTAMTAADGTFRIDGLAAGEWRLSLNREGYLEFVLVLQLDGSQDMDFQIDRAGDSATEPTPVPQARARVRK